jgi:hypothetical protein
MKYLKLFEDLDKIVIPDSIKKDIEQTGYKISSVRKHNKDYILRLELVRDLNWSPKDFDRFKWVIQNGGKFRSNDLKDKSFNIKVKLFENIGDKVQCKCGWSWNIEKGDKNPYLCHKCNSVNESISMSSNNELIVLKNSIELISKYDMEFYQAIEVIDKLINMTDWKDIEKWREHLLTNYRRSDLDDFTVELIDRYCSP